MFSFQTQSAESQRKQLINHFQQEAGKTAEISDKICTEAFKNCFKQELIEELGLVLIACGSFGRRQQIMGVSDADLMIYWSKVDPDESRNDSKIQALMPEYIDALEKFSTAISQELHSIGINCDEHIKTAHISDLAKDWQNYKLAALESNSHEVKLKKEKLLEFFVTLSNIFSSRILAGDSSLDPSAAVSEMFKDSQQLQTVINQTAQYLNSLFGEYGTLATSQNNIKERLQRAARTGSTLIEVLKIASLSSSDVIIPECFRQIQESLDNIYIDLAIIRKSHKAAVKSLPGRVGKPSEEFRFSDHKVLSDKFTEITDCNLADPVKWLYQSAEELDFNLKRLIYFISEGDCRVDTYAKYELSRDPFSVRGYVASTLRAHINLDRTYLPAYQALRGIVDRHSYQRFTMFEHGLKSAENLDKLERGVDKDERYVNLFSKLNDNQKKVLYFATLFHDCAKRREKEMGITDNYWHAKEGAKIAMDQAAAVGFGFEDQRLIGQLIANHLWLKDISKLSLHSIYSAVARLPEDMRNPEFIDLLTLLTYADLKSTDPEGWTIFRANHLFKSANAAHLHITGKQAIDSPENFTDQLLSSSFSFRIRNPDRQEIINFIQLLPEDFIELPKETVCDFLNLYTSYQDQPVVQLLPHNLASDMHDSSFRVDLLLIARDRRFLASNVAEQVSKMAFTIQSADFFTNSKGEVFNRLTFSSKYDRSDDLDRLKINISQCLSNQNLSIPNVSSLNKLPDDAIIELVNPKFPPSDTSFMLKIKTTDSNGLLLRLLTGFNKVGLAVTSCCINTEGDKAEDFFELSLNGRTPSEGVTSEIQEKYLELLKHEFLPQLETGAKSHKI